jgi:hypothetical protein
MNQTIHLHKDRRQGLDISRRDDGVFVLRTWRTSPSGVVKAQPSILLTEVDMMGLFDDIGRSLILTLEQELALVLEAM